MAAAKDMPLSDRDSGKRIIILTNYSFNESNSFARALAHEEFLVAQLLNNQPGISEVCIASREENLGFINGETDFVSCVKLDDNFDFTDPQLHLKARQSEFFGAFDAAVIHPFLDLDSVAHDFFSTLKKRFSPSITYINDPEGIITASDKRFLTKFPDHCDLTKIQSKEDLDQALKKQPLVLKPAFGHGGRDVLRIQEDMVHDGFTKQPLAEVYEDILKAIDETPYVAMEYYNPEPGEKRIFVSHGKAVGQFLKKPVIREDVAAAAAWHMNRSEMTLESCGLTEEENEMIQEISDELAKIGVINYALDTMEDFSGKRKIVEINLMNPGGISIAAGFQGFNVFSDMISAMIDYLNQTDTPPSPVVPKHPQAQAFML